MEFIQIEVNQGVGIIRLNRPDVFNSFNRQMAFECQAALDQFAA
jgi:2-(1,2-epoxy-1,2-dihydrophenyl)acetyl-CoA isomerase